MANDTRVMTGKVRLSYVHLFKPYSAEKGQEEKYSCTILVPKTDVQTKMKLDAAINAAIEKGISSVWNGVKPPKPTIPIYFGPLYLKHFLYKFLYHLIFHFDLIN